MRPPELDVQFSLYELDCKTTEDSGGDEIYMWALGFKVDADTLGPPSISLAPTLGVQIFQGIPSFPFIVGPDDEINAGRTYSIPHNLGTRNFHLKPALLDGIGWFPGIAGVVCLLWDQDAFSPSTEEAGHNKFNALFGPSLSTELNSLINGTDPDYDIALSKDSDGNVVSTLSGIPFAWRISRLRDPGGRKNAVKTIVSKVKDKISSGIKSAFKDAAGWDELLDPDDLLGAEAQVYLGDELVGMKSFTLDFTDDDADYTIKGNVFGSRPNIARLDATVIKVSSQFDRNVGIWRQVCWFPPNLYWANAFRVQTTTRFSLTSLVGILPNSVRWFLDDTPLANGSGSITVNYEPTDKYEGPPQDALASYYAGGPGVLNFNATGTVLEIVNQGGDGVFFGTITALYAYPGDPSLTPPPQPPLTTAQVLDRGYHQSADLSIIAVDLEMSDDYKADVARCKRITDEIDRKHIAVNFGKAKVNPGDPPLSRQALIDRATGDARLANAVGLANSPAALTSTPVIR